MAAGLEPEFIDEATLSELRDQLSPDASTWYLFRKMQIFRSSVKHPLNGDFLDSCLEAMTVEIRDRSWTEWVRKNSDSLREDIGVWCGRWQQDLTRTVGDRMIANWFSWCLTSTNKTLRDEATRAIYFYALEDPPAFLELTELRFKVNDLYVLERLLAVCYGLVLAYTHDQKKLKQLFIPFAKKLFEALFEKRTIATSHLLIWEYSRRLIEIVFQASPSDFQDTVLNEISPGCGFPDTWDRICIEEYPGGKPDYIYYTDFHNYTMGRLVPDRGNYKFEHPEFQKLFEKLLWRINQLGFDWNHFKEIDESIARSTTDRRLEPDRVERYGKKYCWIAYYELAGLQVDRGVIGPYEFEGRMSLVDIDPTFPGAPSEKKFVELGLKSLDVDDPIAIVVVPLSWKDENGEDWLLIREIATETGSSDDFGRVECECLFARASDRNRLEGLIKSVTEMPWLSENQRYYVFAGEVVNPSVISRLSFEDLDFRVGESKEDIEEETLSFYRADGSEYPKADLWRKVIVKASQSECDTETALEQILSEEQLECKEVVSVREVVNVTSEHVEVFNPAWQHCWESYHSRVNPSCSVYFPAIELVEDMQLSSRSQSYDLFCPEGREATKYFEYSNEQKSGRNQASENETTYFFRQDLLSHYLASNGLIAFWITSFRSRKGKEWKDVFQIQIWDPE